MTQARPRPLDALLLCASLLSPLVAAAAPADPLASAGQLLLVTAHDWHSTGATLRRFERKQESAAWTAVGSPMSVSLGRHGLAWGRGLHPLTGIQGPIKREGDGRAPAGVFRLSAAFGDEQAVPAIADTAKLPFTPVSAELKCVDDSASRYYNQIVDRREIIDTDWQSHEEMRRDDGQYSLGIVVAHNAALPVPGAGSCIFLHVWRAPGAPTAGCTAGTFDDLVMLFAWLDASRQPLLVQLPQREYQRRRSAWKLP